MSVLAASLGVLLAGDVTVRMVQMRAFRNGKDFGTSTYMHTYHPDGGRTTVFSHKARHAPGQFLQTIQ